MYLLLLYTYFIIHVVLLSMKVYYYRGYKTNVNFVYIFYADAQNNDIYFS